MINNKESLAGLKGAIIGGGFLTMIFSEILEKIGAKDYIVFDRNDYKIKSITANIVRDEGVYKIPKNRKKKILDAYTYLTNKILEDYKNDRLNNYNTDTLEGRIINKKNFMLYKIMKKQYLNPYFSSTCHAGSLFGIIGADGTVYPCEILDKPLGNLRNFNYDFLSLWHNKKTKKAVTRWQDILKTEYEEEDEEDKACLICSL